MKHIIMLDILYFNSHLSTTDLTTTNDDIIYVGNTSTVATIILWIIVAASEAFL